MSDWVTLRDVLGLTLRPIDAWPGQPRHDRAASPFSAPFRDTLAKLRRELSALAARGIVLQVALREQDLRLDGLPRSEARAAHPGVILAFESRHGPLRLVFDGFTKWQDNLRAISLHLENLRHAGLYGVGTDGQQYQGWKALSAAADVETPKTPEEAAAWLAVILFESPEDLSRAVSVILASSAMATDAYRKAARKLHPDAGGDHERFVRLGIAKGILDRHHGL